MFMKSLSLKNKTILFFLLSISIISMISIFITYTKMKESSLNNLNNQYNLISLQGDVLMKQWYETRTNMVHSVNERFVDDKDVMLKHLIQGENNGIFDLVYIGYNDKSVLFSKEQKDLPKDYDPTKRPWYINAISKGSMSLSEPYFDASTHQLVASFSEPLKSGKGVLSSDISLG